MQKKEKRETIEIAIDVAGCKGRVLEFHLRTFGIAEFEYSNVTSNGGILHSPDRKYEENYLDTALFGIRCF